MHIDPAVAAGRFPRRALSRVQLPATSRRRPKWHPARRGVLPILNLKKREIKYRCKVRKRLLEFYEGPASMC